MLKRAMLGVVLTLALVLGTFSQATADPAVARYLESLHARITVTQVWRYLGATEDEIRVMHCLGHYESHWSPWAYSRTNDYGVLQINGGWFGPRGWFNNTVTPELAYANPYDLGTQALGSWVIYTRSGWRAWTTARHCGV